MGEDLRSNRQRQGSIGTYEGKATSQQAIVQSSHITEDIFRKFSRFEQRDLQGLLDYSKEAWITGKKAMYVMPDLNTQFLELDSFEHMESEYGVFVSDSGRDQDKLEQAKALSQSMIQNGVPASAVLDLFDTENYAGIKDKIKRAENAQKELDQAQQQAQQEQAAQQAQIQQQQIQQNAIDKEKDRQLEIEVALIKAEASDNEDRLNLDMAKMQQQFELKRKRT